ncbi:unnamed protein product [Triticum turgidum subsp. durum]|uniref:Uncharacterized protein n=1 Tax=Triticum turgidum subsp. durum TaxID=4567 RepID=A0A9R0VXH0_TRITD|nr:unnamed protein product [Triticum turgidum subsp. durum]
MGSARSTATPCSVCVRVYMGVTTSQLDELAAETAAALTASQPDYASVRSLFRSVSPLPVRSIPPHGARVRVSWSDVCACVVLLQLAARIVVPNLPPSGNSLCGACK